MKPINYFILLVLLANILISCSIPVGNREIKVALPGDELYEQRQKMLRGVVDNTSNHISPQNLCPECSGTGRIVKNVTVNIVGTDKIVRCKECKKKYRLSEGHTHEYCPICRRYK